MSSAMIDVLIAAGIAGAIGTGWMIHLQNRHRRSRAGAGSDGGSSSGIDNSSNDGFSLGSWFSSDNAGSSSDAGNCASDDSSSGGGDCGGGDGGGGGD